MIDIQYRKQLLAANISYYVFLFWIIILTFVNGILLLFPMQAGSRQVLSLIDGLLGTFLLLEFLYRFVKTPQRRHYFFRGLGWMDLLGSLPIPFSALLRLTPLVLAARAMEGPDIDSALRRAAGKRAQNTLLAFVLATVVIFEVSGVLVLFFEAGQAGASIETGVDALWWAFS